MYIGCVENSPRMKKSFTKFKGINGERGEGAVEGVISSQGFPGSFPVFLISSTFY